MWQAYLCSAQDEGGCLALQFPAALHSKQKLMVACNSCRWAIAAKATPNCSQQHSSYMLWRLQRTTALSTSSSWELEDNSLCPGCTQLPVLAAGVLVA
jgi:hypothetical protein